MSSVHLLLQSAYHGSRNTPRLNLISFNSLLPFGKQKQTNLSKCPLVRLNVSKYTLNMLIFMLAQPMDTVGQMYEPLPPDALYIEKQLLSQNKFSNFVFGHIFGTDRGDV